MNQATFASVFFRAARLLCPTGGQPVNRDATSWNKKKVSKCNENVILLLLLLHRATELCAEVEDGRDYAWLGRTHGFPIFSFLRTRLDEC